MRTAARGPGEHLASNELALDAFDRIDPARRVDVRYEKLVADPLSSIREICERVGIPLDKGYEIGPKR